MAKRPLGPGGLPFVSNAEFAAMTKAAGHPQQVDAPWDEPPPEHLRGDGGRLDDEDSCGAEAVTTDSDDLGLDDPFPPGPLQPPGPPPPPATNPAVVKIVAPKPVSQTVPDIKSGTIQEYLMSVDVNQRPAVALVQATRKLLVVSAHQDEAIAVILAAVEHVQSLEGFSARAKEELHAYFLGTGGVVDQFKSTFATERQLTREATTGGLVDAATVVEGLIEKYGEAKRAEFDAHAVTKMAELDREMHRITLFSLQSTLAAIVGEKTELAAEWEKHKAANVYARRLGLAYGFAGVFAGLFAGVAVAVALCAHLVR